FDIAGVLVSTYKSSGAVNATLTSSGGISINPGSASITVINSVQVGLVDPGVPTGGLPTAVTSLPNAGTTPIAGGPAVILSSTPGTVLKSNFTLRIQEGFASMLREASQFNG